jgi:hypothetical protein
MVWVRVSLGIAAISVPIIVPMLGAQSEYATHAGETCQASSSVQNCRVDITLHGKNKGVRIEFDLETGKGRLTDLMSGKVTPLETSERSGGAREMREGPTRLSPEPGQ